MKYKEILKTLEIIECALDDAFYSLPEYNANTSSKDYLDDARNEVYCLRDELERTIWDKDKVISGTELDEVMNTPVVNPL